MTEIQDVAISRRRVADSIREKNAARPGNVDANGRSDLDRADAERAERRFNGGSSDAEVRQAQSQRTAAEVAEQAEQAVSMRPIRSQGSSANGPVPLIPVTFEERMKAQTRRMPFDQGGGSR